MGKKKNLDAFLARKKKVKSINRYQEKMLRARLESSETNDDVSDDACDIQASSSAFSETQIDIGNTSSKCEVISKNPSAHEVQLKSTAKNTSFLIETQVDMIDNPSISQIQSSSTPKTTLTSMETQVDSSNNPSRSSATIDSQVEMSHSLTYRGIQSSSTQKTTLASIETQEDMSDNPSPSDVQSSSTVKTTLAVINTQVEVSNNPSACCEVQSSSTQKTILASMETQEDRSYNPSPSDAQSRFTFKTRTGIIDTQVEMSNNPSTSEIQPSITTKTSSAPQSSQPKTFSDFIEIHDLLGETTNSPSSIKMFVNDSLKFENFETTFNDDSNFAQLKHQADKENIHNVSQRQQTLKSLQQSKSFQEPTNVNNINNQQEVLQNIDIVAQSRDKNNAETESEGTGIILENCNNNTPECNKNLLDQNTPEKQNSSDNIEIKSLLNPETGMFEDDVRCNYDLHNSDIDQVETPVSSSTPQQNNFSEERKIPRKRRIVNKFRKSCIDFIEDDTVAEFSAGSSDAWSVKESGSSTDTDDEVMKKKKKKKKKIEKEKVSKKKVKKPNKALIRKKLRNEGKEHVSRKGIIIEPKSLKENPCLDGKCGRSCKDISEERRNDIFKYFWGLDSQRKRDWLVRCAQVMTVQRKKTKNEESRRSKTYQYFINEGEGHKKVCQKFLLNTLDITQRYLLYTLDNTIERMGHVDKRHPNAGIKYTDEERDNAKQFIEALPAVSSHYCRRDSTKTYLPQEYKNISNLYRMYAKKCEENSEGKLSEQMFRKLFTEDYNISFHVPKKDKCVTCTKYADKDAEITENDRIALNKHTEEKKATYARFKIHQTLNPNDHDTLTTSFDLQKVLNTPYGQSMLLYYSRKYCMYNLTFYESVTQNVTCYLWGESDGKRGSQEISTCLYKYLKHVDDRGIKNVLMYCDSCTGQNKNRVVLATLNYFLQTSKNLQVIQINYLLPGHTYMPVDSVHAVIENEVKKLIVWSPSQWSAYIETARKRPKPYEVNVLDYSDFMNFEELASKTITQETVKQLKLKQIRVATFKKNAPNVVEIKYSMKDDTEIQKITLNRTDNQYTKNTRTRKGKGRGKGKGKVTLSGDLEREKNDVTDQTETIGFTLKPLYETKLPISLKKYNDLKRLCDNNTIPKRFHAEYLNLPCVSNVPDVLPETDDEDEVEDYFF